MSSVPCVLFQAFFFISYVSVFSCHIGKGMNFTILSAVLYFISGALDVFDNTIWENWMHLEGQDVVEIISVFCSLMAAVIWWVDEWKLAPRNECAETAPLFRWGFDPELSSRRYPKMGSDLV
jgi:hypothetical protein